MILFSTLTLFFFDHIMDVIKFELNAYSKRTKLLGLIPIGWVPRDSVYFDSDLCKFDFSERRVLRTSGECTRSIGEIVSTKPSRFRQASLLPFVGVVRTSEVEVATFLGFLGSELNLDLTIKEDRVSRKITFDTTSVVLGDCFSFAMDWHRRTMTMEASPIYVDSAMVVGTIIFKFAMEYCQSGVDG